jgi:glycine hydroxymethyltransferase
VRLGKPAATTRGMKEEEMEKIGKWIVGALKNHQDESYLAGLKKEVEELFVKFPVPGI